VRAFLDQPKDILMIIKPTYEELEQKVKVLEKESVKWKRAEEALQEREGDYRQIVETTYEGVWIIDATGKTIFVNRRMAEMLGYTADEMAGQSLFLFMDAEWQTLAKEFIDLDRNRQGIVGQYDFKFRRKNGTDLWALLKTSPTFDKEGLYIGSLGMITDITERKRAEEELQKAHEELEVRIKQRTAELEKANEELRKEIAERIQVQNQLVESEAHIRSLNEQILNMLMVVSHDVRSPLVSIEATLKLLVRGVYGELHEGAKNTVTDLYERVNRLRGTTEECLGKASVVTGDIYFEREMLDLREDIIDPVLDEFSQEIENQEIVIDNRLGSIPANKIPIKADKVWLRVVFRNLFRNAIKHGGKQCTMAFGFENCGANYKLNVYNSGEPIPSDFQEKLFSKFFRVGKEAETAEKGMGLGLHLVKEIIQKHGGDIWYEAKEYGSNFVFTLPCD